MKLVITDVDAEPETMRDDFVVPTIANGGFVGTEFEEVGPILETVMETLKRTGHISQRWDIMTMLGAYARTTGRMAADPAYRAQVIARGATIAHLELGEMPAFRSLLIPRSSAFPRAASTGPRRR